MTAPIRLSAKDQTEQERKLTRSMSHLSMAGTRKSFLGDNVDLYEAAADGSA